MIQSAQHRLKSVLSVLLFLNICARASDLDTLGVTALRAVDPTLIGTGVYVTQAEASTSTTEDQFEVNPLAVGQPTNLFTWIGNSGSSSTFPNSVGTESSHADGVASHFYHIYAGPAPGVLHVDNYFADPFYNNVISLQSPTSGKVVNESFYFNGTPPDATVNSLYDNYVARYGTIFGNIAGNGGTVVSPGSAYNVITVGVSDGTTSTGGTPDGRAKPDLWAPGLATSFSAPYVSGAATVLLQAATRGDGGTTNISAASDVRTIKALLINGAVKPSNWTHTASVPLDITHGSGAGMLNLINSYEQMIGRQRRPIETTSVGTGAAHPPGSSPANEASLVGWDFGTISTISQDTIAHYYFNLPATNGNYTLTASLVWNRALNASSINDLDLFLYRTSDGAQITLSTSRVDNVEHIYIPSLSPGRYDLQVLKNSGSRSITGSETYALAFESFVIGMTITRQPNSVAITWPLYPNGFNLESTPSLSPPITWTPVTNAPLISNNVYQVSVNSLGNMSFYRLKR